MNNTHIVLDSLTTLELIETKSIWDSTESIFAKERIVNNLGKYERYGQIAPIVQQWFKGKGADRTIDRKYEKYGQIVPIVQQWFKGKSVDRTIHRKKQLKDYTGTQTYSPEFYMPMALYRNDDKQQYTFSKLFVAYFDYMQQALMIPYYNYRIAQMQVFGVPIVIVYQNKRQLKRCTLYIKIHLVES